MNKFVKICFMLSVICISVFGTSVVASAEDNYFFTSYDVNMDVGNDNSYKIKETIQCHFTKSSHGIYRKIPIVNSIERADGSKTTNRAVISDVYCNRPFTTSIDGNYYVLKIGNVDRYADVDTEYVIQYTYTIGKDSNTDFDELYFNLYGTEWEGETELVTFEINMPKKFDKSKLGFSGGKIGQPDGDVVYYDVEGTKITGEYFGPLKPKYGLTVRCELPEGYFSDAKYNLDKTSLLFFNISFFSFVLIVIIYISNMKSKNTYAPTVEFYPPENLLCTDLACVLDGSVSRQQMIAVVFHLAEKGYIQIQDGYNTSASKKKTKNISYCFVKLKEYDGDNYIERKVFNGLFLENDKFANSKTLDKPFNDELVEAINTQYKPSKNNILEPNFYDRIFKRAVFKPKVISTILLLVCALVGIIFANIFYYGQFNSQMVSGTLQNLEMILLLFVALSYCLIRPIMKLFSSNKFPYISGAILILFGLIFFNGEQYSIMQKLSIKSSFVFIAVGYLLITKIQNKRTDYGNQLYAKTIGFKNFLNVAEKPKLEELVNENPNYFFDILPYAFTLGVSDKWIGKFTEMYMPKPDWYITNDYYDIRCWNYVYHNTYSNMMDSISPSGSDSFGSSGSSGGGISGGGSGGGGGGSW